jgi:hypothetical protein
MEEHNIFDLVTCPCQRSDPVTFTCNDWRIFLVSKMEESSTTFNDMGLMLLPTNVNGVVKIVGSMMDWFYFIQRNVGQESQTSNLCT